MQRNSKVVTGKGRARCDEAVEIVGAAEFEQNRAPEQNIGSRVTFIATLATRLELFLSTALVSLLPSALVEVVKHGLVPFTA